MDWNDLKIILALNRTKSKSEAAISLGVSQPTISRRISEIEKRYRVNLFKRTKTGYRLSATGQEIHELSKKMEKSANSIERMLDRHDNNTAGTVALTTTPAMAAFYLSKHMKSFSEMHPNISVNLKTSHDSLSVSMGEADIALRVTDAPEEALIGRPLVQMAVAAYAACGVVNDVRKKKASELSWIGWNDSKLHNRYHDQDLIIHHKVNDMPTMKAMVGAGLGLGLLPCYYADLDPKIERVWPDMEPIKRSKVWMLRHRDTKNVRKYREVSAFFSRAIKKEKDLFEGRWPADWSGDR